MICFDIGAHHADLAQLVRRRTHGGRQQDIVAGEETTDDPASAVDHVDRLGLVARRKLAGIFAIRPGNRFDNLAVAGRPSTFSANASWARV